MDVQQFVIRPALEEDNLRIIYDFWPKLQAPLLEVASRGVRKWYRLQREIFEKAVTAGGVIVAQPPFSSPLGYALYEQECSALHLKQLFVHQDFRNLKVGKRLLQRVAEDALVLGVFSIHLELPTKKPKSARRFYERNGFNFRLGDKYTLDRMECRDLRKVLAR